MIVKKWIEDLNKNKSHLKEGKHYSFAIYGGANLTNYDIFSTRDCIDMIHLGRNAVIVCDSDKSDESSELKQRVKNIHDSIEKANMIRESNMVQNYKNLILWITKGREIENYIPKDLLISVLSSSDFVKKYINAKDGASVKRENIKMQCKDMIDFGQYDSFDEYAASLYTKEDDSALSSQELSKLANNISKNKNAMAVKICEQWEAEHYDNLDIEERINEIINLIYLSNGMGIHQKL